MWIFILALVIGIFFITKRWTERFVMPQNPIFHIWRSPIGYKKRTCLLNNSESALFFELQKQLPPEYHIFPNMRLADIVDPINYRGHYEYRQKARKIMPKHIDFIICDSTFKPIVAIELNGNSHNRLDRMEMDEEKKKILEEAQIPLIIIKVGDNFTEALLRIKSLL